jgi:hypothetical protein
MKASKRGAFIKLITASCVTPPPHNPTPRPEFSLADLFPYTRLLTYFNALNTLEIQYRVFYILVSCLNV